MNMFAALNDTDSDDEGPKQTQKAPVPAPAAKVERKPERKPRAPQVRDGDRPPRAERDSGPYDGSDKVSNPAADRERQGKGKGERRERDGKGKGKGKGESRGDSGREFPRRSATGRGRENAKAGGGKFNWGKDDAQPPAEGAEAVEGETPAAPVERAPVVEEEPEEETMSLEEFEKAQAESMASLNLNKCIAAADVEAPDESMKMTDVANNVEDQYKLMFHAPEDRKKKHGRKEARVGAKQADLVLNMKYVDENADAGKGAGKGKGERRSKGDGAKGGRSSGKGQAPREAPAQGGKPSVDLSNDVAFPTLGA